MKKKTTHRWRKKVIKKYLILVEICKQEEAKTSMVEDKISWKTWLQRLYREGEEVGGE